MNTKLLIKLAIILILAGFLAIADIPGGFPKIGISKEPKLKKGLDLVGGTHIAYVADVSKIESGNQDQAIKSLVEVIDRRINALGVTEPVIQSRKIGSQYGLVVELPGIKDINEAIDLIGKTAQLQFKEGGTAGTSNLGSGTFSGKELEQLQKQQQQGWKETNLSGRHLKKAEVQFDQQGKSEIAIEFNPEGAKIFADITKRNLQKPVAIFLDNEVISAPTVQSEIKGGKAVITGDFTIDEAKQLAIQLNAGALPVPIKIAEQRTVGATLGSDSVKNSLFAGLIGLFLVALFMILYYRIPGFLAVTALIIYTVLVLGIFKISALTPWGFTLTLPGIAGFILSVGMAIDANILIFERTKEEIRAERPIVTAIDNGFQRAWPSIRDSNISSLITCLILFWFGTGAIRGFALTLGIGILVSMFTAITVTKTFLQLATLGRLKEKLRWFKV